VKRDTWFLLLPAGLVGFFWGGLAWALGATGKESISIGLVTALIALYALALAWAAE
jgi:hypothetical protein